MGTISDKLTYLANTKTAIKNAIVAKGVTVEDNATFRSYADKINSIQTGSGGETAKIDINGFRFSRSTFTHFDPSLFDFSNITDCYRMFESCEKMKSIGWFNTSKIVIMDSMFMACIALEEIPLFDTSKVENASNLFYNCFKLSSIPPFNTSNVTKAPCMFYGCHLITELPLFDMSNCTTINGIINDCPNLTTLGGFTGLQVNLMINQNDKLTAESVMNIINQAADMSAQPRTLTLHSTVFKKLTEDQIATANAKGWNIAS